MDNEWIKTIINLSIGLFFGIIGTWFGARINHLFIKKRENEKEKKDLDKIEELIKDDLIDKKKTLYRMEQVLLVLDVKLKTKEPIDYPNDVFQDLHIDIYEGVSRIDLHKIFKEDFFLLINVYKAILHLKDRSPAKIRSEYFQAVNNYAYALTNDSVDTYCQNYASIAIKQIQANIETIKSLYEEIDFLLENLENPKGRLTNKNRERLVNTREIDI